MSYDFLAGAFGKEDKQSGYTNSQPVNIENDLVANQQEQAEAKLKESEKTRTFSSDFQETKEINNSFKRSQEMAELNASPVDSTFDPTEKYSSEELTEYYKDIDPQFLDEVHEYRSESTWLARIENAKELTKKTRELEARGVKGSLGDIASNIKDPTIWLEMFGGASGGLKGAGKVGKVIAGATEGAVVSGLIEKARADSISGYNNTDAVRNTAVGMAFGGTIGAVAGAFSKNADVPSPKPEPVEKPKLDTADTKVLGYQESVKAASDDAGVDANLALAVMRQESAGDPEAVSKVGAEGLFQHMPDTAKELGIDPKIPEESIDGGVRYIKQTMDWAGGDENLALAMYNHGIGNVRKLEAEHGKGFENIQPHLPKETQDYVEKVQAHKVRFSGQYGTLNPAQQVSNDVVTDTSAGAMENPFTAAPSAEKRLDNDVIGDSDVDKVMWGDRNKREKVADFIDISGTDYAKDSDSPTLRAFYDNAFTSTSGRGAQTTDITTAQDLIFNTHVRSGLSAMDEQWKLFGKTWKQNGHQKLNFNEFNELVADTVESGGTSGIKEVDAAARAYSHTVEQLRKEASADGRINIKSGEGSAVRGFAEMTPKPNYFTRVFNRKKIAELQQNISREELQGFFVDLFHHSFKPVGDEAVESINKLAKSYSKTVLGLGDDMVGVDLSKILNGTEIDDLMIVLRESGVDEETLGTAEGVLRKQRAKGDKSHANTRHRVEIDTQFKTNVRTESGELVELSVKNFVDRNASDVLYQYGRTMSGDIALAMKGIKSKADLNQLKAKIADELSHDPQKAKEALERIDFYSKKWRGSSTLADPSKLRYSIMRTMKNYAVLNFMENVIWPSLSDLGAVIGVRGFKLISRDIPATNVLLKRIKKGGKEAEQAVQDVSIIVGEGFQRSDNQVIAKFADDYGALPKDVIQGEQRDIAQKAGDAVRSTDNFIRTKVMPKFGQVTGIQYYDDFIHNTVVRGVMNSFAEAAFGTGKKLSKKRLAEIGLDDELVEQVFGEMRKHAKPFKNSLGSEVHHFNFDQWDEQVLQAFMFGVNRRTNFIKQRNMIGDLPHWLESSPYAQWALQFRSFQMVAASKQMARGVRHMDAEVARTFAAGVAVTSVWYMAKVHTQAALMDEEEREQFLEKRLSPKSFGAAVIKYNSMMALVPEITDSTITFTNYGIEGYNKALNKEDEVQKLEHLFKYSRASGLNSSAASIEDVPSVSAVTGTATAIWSLLDNLSEDNDFSQKDVKQLQRALPFGDFVPFAPMINGLKENLPEE